MARKRFNDHPFPYHAELELEISTLTNLGAGLARVALDEGVKAEGGRLKDGNAEPETQNPEPETTPPVAGGGPGRRSLGEGGWVVMVPFALPGERVRARIFRNHKNYSEADLVAVLRPSPQRIVPSCPLFAVCGGCQYQNLAYAEQLVWKRRHVTELLRHMARIEFPVNATMPSPREFGYRSKITPHFEPPRSAAEISNPGFQTPRKSPGETQDAERRTQNTPEAAFPIGFLKQSSRFALVDVPRCPIATDAINARLGAVREEIRAKAAAGRYKRGATVLLRDSLEGVTTDYDATITEEIAIEEPAGSGGDHLPSSIAHRPSSIRLRFLARDFFQNNPFILPAFTGHVRAQAAATGARFLVDAYCGSGLFALASAHRFERVTGIEISATSVKWAQENAAANGIANATFHTGDAAAIFAGLDFPAADTAVVIDPPRRGCDEAFLRQLAAFGPRAIVYVSCDPATQMRDLATLLPASYELTDVQPFDLFPQTRHLECVITLRRK